MLARVATTAIVPLLLVIGGCEEFDTENLVVENRTDHTLTIVKLTPTEDVTLEPTVPPALTGLNPQHQVWA